MFDYKEFAESMASQAEKLVPPDFSEENQKYLVETLRNFSSLCGEALVNDDSLNFSDEQKMFITQIIAEWTFHKATDIIHSDIPREYYDQVMQKIAFAAFEVSKQGLLKGLEQSEVLQAVEHHVQKSYAECIEELYEKNQINEEEKFKARHQSNIDTMAEKIKWEKDNPTENTENFNPQEKDYYKKFNINTPRQFFKDNTFIEKIKESCCKYKFTTVYTVIFVIIHVVLYLRGIIDFKNLSIAFGLYGIIITVGLYIANKITMNKQLKELENVRQQMQDLVNPEKMYERLGVDLISIFVGKDLLTISDPDQDGPLLPKIAAMRQRLTDKLGYIIPSVRIMDTSELCGAEYHIYIRGNKAADGIVFPDLYMVLAEEWDKKYDTLPKTYNMALDPTYKTQVYWMDKADIPDDIKAVSADDVMIKHLEEILIKNVNEILTIKQVYKYIELVKVGYSSEITDELLERLSVADIRRILINLISERISIKDISYIFEKMFDYSRFTTNPTTISEQIRATLGRQICHKYTDKYDVIYTVELSKEIETLLKDSIQSTEFGEMFMLSPSQINELVEATAATLMNARTVCNHQPVILCAPAIRFPLYRLLVRHIPTVNVISYSELTTEIKVEAMNDIEI